MRNLSHISRAISAGLFAVTLFSILAQVVFRYALELPLGWTSEVAINSFLIGAWWTICMNVRLKEHVQISLFIHLLSPRTQDAVQAVASTFGATMLFIALPGCLRYLEVVNRLETGVLKVPLSWVYWIFALFLIVIGLRLSFHAVTSLNRAICGRRT